MAFWFNPPVVEGSASPTPLRMRLAYLEEWASALTAEAGSAICCSSWGSKLACLSWSSPAELVGTANWGGQKSENISSPSGSKSVVPEGLEAWTVSGARRP